MKRIVILTFLFCLTVVPVYASENSQTKDTYMVAEEDSALPESEIDSSTDIQYGKEKGSIISTAILTITNEGKGKIGISILTLAHRTCDKIRHKAYLEQWDANAEDWKLIETFDFSETLDDHPDGYFPSLSTSITVTGAPAGYLYRATGAHAVWKDGVSETLNTVTEGVFITK